MVWRGGEGGGGQKGVSREAGWCGTERGSLVHLLVQGSEQGMAERPFGERGEPGMAERPFREGG